MAVHVYHLTVIAETSGFPGLADHPVKPLGKLWVSDNFHKQGEK